VAPVDWEGMADASERFAALVSASEDDLPLDEAALLIAAHAYPELDIATELAVLDTLAQRCVAPTLDALLNHLFRREWFVGNRVDYADVRNSYLNEVLGRRLGIPITLSVLLMEVGKRLGLKIDGVGMPGHFLARCGDVWIDAFDAGRPLDRQACFELFLRVGGTPAAFDPAFLEPVGPRSILARMLANLRVSYAQRGDAAALEWVGRLRLAIPGVPLSDHAEHARLLVGLGRFGEAADAFEHIATLGDAADAAAYEAEANSLRARLN
jgi:regulator of sirC expression with transglutaminase-like and TPR domain